MVTLTERRVRGSVQEAQELIAEAIHRGSWRFQQRLPAERTLAFQLGVSRTTVRRACRRLVDAGVLEVRSGQGPSSGTFVRSELVPRGMLADPTSLPLGEISGVLEARRSFEPNVAQLAARAATEEDLAEMERIIELQEQFAHDPHRVSLLDPSFHLGMARATHNETVLALMEVLHGRLELLRKTDFRPGTAREAIDSHRQTLDAITGRDPDEIERVMDAHLALMERAWEAQGGGTLATQRASRGPKAGRRQARASR